MTTEGSTALDYTSTQAGSSEDFYLESGAEPEAKQPEVEASSEGGEGEAPSAEQDDDMPGRLDILTRQLTKSRAAEAALKAREAKAIEREQQILQQEELLRLAREDPYELIKQHHGSKKSEIYQKFTQDALEETNENAPESRIERLEAQLEEFRAAQAEEKRIAAERELNERRNHAESTYFKNIKETIEADEGMKRNVHGFYDALGVTMDADLKTIAEGYLRATGKVLTEEQMAGRISTWVEKRIPHLKQWLTALESDPESVKPPTISEEKPSDPPRTLTNNMAARSPSVASKETFKGRPSYLDEQDEWGEVLAKRRESQTG